MSVSGKDFSSLSLCLYIYTPSCEYAQCSAHNRHSVNIIIVTSAFVSLIMYVYSIDSLCIYVFKYLDHKQDETEPFLAFQSF